MKNTMRSLSTIEWLDESESIPSVTNEEDELWSYVIEFIFLSDLSSEEKKERLKQHFTISRKPSSSSLHS
jgi:hypothetical protein